MRRPAGSWSNDQLSSAFTAPAARLSSRTVQQNQKWSPELPYSSRTGPAQQRADHAAKSRHLTSATQVAGAKNLPNEPPPLRRTNHPRRVVRTTPAASCGEGWFARRAVRPIYPRLATYIDWQIRWYRFLFHAPPREKEKTRESATLTPLARLSTRRVLSAWTHRRGLTEQASGETRQQEALRPKRPHPPP